MYLWRDVQTKPGYSDTMIRYRNSLAREINFIYSPRYKRVQEDQKIAQEYEALRKGRQRSLDAIDDPSEKRRVEIGLIMEALTPAADFRAAELFMRYFGLSAEDVGGEVYYTMRQPDSIYSNMQKDGRWIEAFQFIRFFPWNDASNEFESLLVKIVEAKDPQAFMMMVKEMENPPFDRMKRDAEVRKVLEKECDRALDEKNLDQAREICRILEDRDRENLINAAEALIRRDFDEAFQLLAGTVRVQKLRNLIVDIHEEEMKRGEKDVQGYKNAFNLAAHGNLVSEENKRYLEQPANKLVEYLIGNPNATDYDYEEALKYARHANPRFISNIVALKCIDLVTQNDAKTAKKLKEMFDPNFSPSMYDEEKHVRSVFARLTETKGIHDIPKGEENLRMAWDIAQIFDFPDSETSEIDVLLCKFYITNKNYEKAAKHFNPKNEGILELIESDIHKRVQLGDYISPYKMLKMLKFEFPRKSKITEENTLKEFAAAHGADSNPSALAKAIVLEDIFELDVLPYSYYESVISNATQNPSSGAALLVDLREVLSRKMDSTMKIDLYRVVQNLQRANDPAGQKIFTAYSNVLPPSIFDWIIYYIMRILAVIF